MAEDAPERGSDGAEDADGSSPPEPGSADGQATANGSAVTQAPSGSEKAHSVGGDSGTREEQIGPYRLIRELGKGGMGTVYLASRTDAEFHKQVALKVVTTETDRAEVIRRFQRERRILSSLSTRTLPDSSTAVPLMTAGPTSSWTTSRACR